MASILKAQEKILCHVDQAMISGKVNSCYGEDHGTTMPTGVVVHPDLTGTDKWPDVTSVSDVPCQPPELLIKKVSNPSLPGVLAIQEILLCRSQQPPQFGHHPNLAVGFDNTPDISQWGISISPYLFGL